MPDLFSYIATVLVLGLLAALGLRDVIAPLRNRRVKRFYGAMIWVCALALFVVIWFNPDFWQSNSILFSKSTR